MSTSAWRPRWLEKVWVFSERTSQRGIMLQSRSPKALLAFGSVCRGMLNQSACGLPIGLYWADG